MSSAIDVRPVDGKAGRKTFIEVAHHVFRDDPQWVAPLHLERMEHLDPKKNPYFDHAEVQLFVAYRDGKPVGRISAQLCRLRQERYHDATGQFGFLDAEDDPALFKALTDAAASWLKARGMKRMLGPFNFSVNDEMGLLIDGFDTPPHMMMGHGLPYYGPRMDALGFAKAKDVIAYRYDGNIPLPRSMAHMYDKAMSAKNIEIRAFDKKHLSRDLDIVISIFNDAWSDNWEFVPFTKGELELLGKNLKMLVANEYIAIANYKGEPAAMAVSLPNLNEWIEGLNGRLLPFGWATAAWRFFRGPPASARIPLMGLRRKFHGTMSGAAMTLGVIDTIRRYHVANGTSWGELSWILEDNMPMRRIIENLGGVPYKTYRMYERAIA